MPKNAMFENESFLIRTKSKKTFDEKQAKKKDSTRRVMATMLRRFDNFCRNYPTWNEKGMDDVIDELVHLKKTINDEQFKQVIYEDVLNPYLAHLSKDGIMRRTQTMYFSAINTYLHHKGISLNEKENRDELDFGRQLEDELYVLTMDDIQKIFSVIPPKKKAFYYSLLSTGCRPSELLQIRKKHIDFSLKRVKIKISSKTTKTSKSRTVFLTKEALNYLSVRLKQIDDDELVFTDNPKTKDVVTKEGILFGNWLDSVGLDEKYESNGRRKITMYSFRSYFFGVCADTHREAYAHRMTGHGGYLPQYDRWNDEKKLEYYLKVEPDLTVNNEERIKIKQEQIDVGNYELEQEKENQQLMKNQMDEMKQEIEELKYGPISRKNKYNQERLDAPGTPKMKIINTGIPLLIELLFPEEKKRDMMREFEKAEQENREPNLHKIFGNRSMDETEIQFLKKYVKENNAKKVSLKSTNSSKHRLKFRHLEITQ
jgi:integrase